MFELGHDPERLRIVIEATEWLHTLIERFLTGMAEGRVPEIMDKRHSFGKIFIEP